MRRMAVAVVAIAALVVLLRAATAAPVDVDDGGRGTIARRWPIACVTGVRAPRLADEPHVAVYENEWAARPWDECHHRLVRMPGGGLDKTDAHVDVAHEWLLLQGAIRSESPSAQARTLVPFWCVFDTGETTSSTPREAIDHRDHKHSSVRTCPVPRRAQRVLDDLQPVHVRVVAPFSRIPEDVPGARLNVGAEPEAGWIRICPHTHRCSPERRAELRLPHNLPVFFLPREPLPARLFGDGRVPATMRPRLRRRELAAMTPAQLQGLGRPYVYKLVGCTMTESTAALTDWIEYHHLVGFDRLVVYDHHRGQPGSTPPLLDALRPQIERGYVEHAPWRYFGPNDGEPFAADDWILQQVLSNNHCIVRYAGLAKWIGMFDRDEYMHARGNYSSVPEVLDDVEHTQPPHFVAAHAYSWFFREKEGSRARLFNARNTLADTQPFRDGRQKTFLLADRALYHAVHQLTQPHVTCSASLDGFTVMRMAHMKPGWSDSTWKPDLTFTYYEPELLRRLARLKTQ